MSRIHDVATSLMFFAALIAPLTHGVVDAWATGRDPRRCNLRNRLDEIGYGQDYRRMLAADGPVEPGPRLRARVDGKIREYELVEVRKPLGSEKLYAFTDEDGVELRFTREELDGMVQSSGQSGIEVLWPDATTVAEAKKTRATTAPVRVDPDEVATGGMVLDSETLKAERKAAEAQAEQLHRAPPARLAQVEHTQGSGVYRLEGTTTTVYATDGRTLEVSLPNIEYRPPPKGVDLQSWAKQKIEAVMGKRKAKLGRVLGRGGMKVVFEERTGFLGLKKTGGVFKVFDPEEMARNFRGVKDPNAIATLLMQREVGYEKVLRDLGLEPYGLDWSANARELWKYGIFRYESAIDAEKVVPRVGAVKADTLRAIDTYERTLQPWQAGFKQLDEQRFGIALESHHTDYATGKVTTEQIDGFDLGGKSRSNIRVKNGKARAIDW